MIRLRFTSFLLLITLLCFHIPVYATSGMDLTKGLNVVSNAVSLVNYGNKTTLAALSIPEGYSDLALFGVNSKPVASFSYKPTTVFTISTLTWDWSGSSDSDGTVTQAQWRLNGVDQPSAPTRLDSVGSNTVSLRVQDDKGAWSSWVTQTIYVTAFTFNPVVFNYVGGYQTFYVPVTATYRLEVWGAEGGGGRSNTGYSKVSGGKGGYAFGNITLTAGDTLYVYVGGKGVDGSTSSTSSGGYNGGGIGRYHSTYGAGGGGGGATDFRLNSTALTNRILVGGGGGGGLYSSNGGQGGGLVGGTGTRGYGHDLAEGGSQTSGGSANTQAAMGTPGALGLGASVPPANPNQNTPFGGGGGSGYYGGAARHDTPGGSGSSYYGTLENGGTVAGNRSDNGQARISLAP